MGGRTCLSPILVSILRPSAKHRKGGRGDKARKADPSSTAESPNAFNALTISDLTPRKTAAAATAKSFQSATLDPMCGVAKKTTPTRDKFTPGTRKLASFESAWKMSSSVGRVACRGLPFLQLVHLASGTPEEGAGPSPIDASQLRKFERY